MTASAKRLICLGAKLMDKTKKRKQFNEKEREFLKNCIPRRSYEEATDLFNDNFKDTLTINQLRKFASKHALTKNQPVQRRPKGNIRLHKGYILVKADDVADWQPLHKIIWEAENGPIPEGHVLTFADGNRQNCDISNLILVTKAERVMMSKYKLRSSDPELTKLGALTARLFLKTHKRKADLNENRNT